MSKKNSKPRTPAERDAAQARAKGRKEANRTNNEWAHNINRDTVDDKYLTILSPLQRGREGAPKTNKGNGSPTRLSQIKRAVSRVGKQRQEQ